MAAVEALTVNETTLESDSHADTSCLGQGALIIEDYCEPVRVQGYNPADGTNIFRTVAGVLGYTHPFTGTVYHLVINQAVEVPALTHHLLAPMQARVYDVKINDVPSYLTENPTNESHSIVAVDDKGESVILPFQLKGVVSSLPVHSITRDEWRANNYPRITLTSKTLTWDPSTTIYEDQENAMRTYDGDIHRDTSTRGPLMVINSLSCNSLSCDAADITADDNFGTALESKVVISSASVVKDSTNRYGNVQSKKGKQVDAATLAKRWGISPDKAVQTVLKTTQRGVRSTLHPALSRRYPTNDRMLRYNRLPHPLFTDTMFAAPDQPSWWRKNTCAQVYTASFPWCCAHAMQHKSDAHESLSLLFHRDGVPPKMVSDGANEMMRGKFKKKCGEADCHLVQTEPHSPWMNAAEGCNRELKKGSSRKMIRTGTPKRLWDYALEAEALVRSHTYHDTFMLNGEVPETVMTGQTADISNICEYAWYEWVKFNDKVSWPNPKMELGRCLGPAIDVGSAMTYHILKSNGQVVVRSTVRSLTQAEIETERDSRRDFDAEITRRLGPGAQREDFDDIDLTPEYPYYDDADSSDDESGDEDGIEGTADEELEPTPEWGDQYLNVELNFPLGGEMAQGQVQSRKRDNDGNPIGRAHANPILDTREYVVKFANGEEAELTANAIAQSMYSQCDPDGNQYVLFNSIVDWRRSTTALCYDDQKIKVNGRNCMRRSTAGWKLCVQWRDGSTSWEKLSDLKESHPLEVAEYAVAQELDQEPAFNWWVRHTLKKRDAIISLVKRRSVRFLKKTHKFGIRVPRTVDEALRLDKENGNTKWADAIAKEMKEVRVAFEIKDDDWVAPKGYQFVKCHMIFDVKMEDFRRKARLVAGGHMTEAPPTMTYASVVSRETVRIALTLAALNDLEVKCGDVLNAYLTAPVLEKVWTVLGPEFGEDAGRKALIVRALYGLKSAGAAFRAHLAKGMRQMGYTSCLADPDLWMKAEVRPDDGFEYYSYILCYVDDILVINHDAMKVIKRIDKYMTIKPSSMGDPDIYLGAKLSKMKMNNNVWCWGLSPSKYVQEAVNNCKKHLTEEYHGKYTMPKKAPNPFPYSYEPEMDTSDVLLPDLASYYQSLIGITRWMIELGRVDISVEVSKLSSHNALPREGHFECLLHLMAYLRDHHNSRMAFDPSYPEIRESAFNKKADWSEFYHEAKEAIPANAPPARGKPVDLRLLTDSDHAGDKSNRRSRTGFLVFLNMSCIDWLSKQQATVERAVFGAEFVALNHGIENVRGIRYKLRMMGVELLGPTYIYGDNMSVINNTSKPESTLKKKSNSICFHAARASVASGESLTSHIRTHHNSADLLTKVTYGNKRRTLVNGLLYDIYDDFEKFS